MKIQLLYIDEIIGDIYPQSASKVTREIKGLLVPTEIYHKYRSPIKQYAEVFGVSDATGLIDKILDESLKGTSINCLLDRK